MLHSFKLSKLTPDSCAYCKRSEDDHGKFAVCESCGFVGPCELWGSLEKNLLLCMREGGCIDKEKTLGNNQFIPLSTLMQQGINIPQPDTSIKIATDVFNAKIASINELKARIDADEKIERKDFALAEVMEKRYEYLKEVIFEKQSIINDALIEQRALQSHYHELAPKLRKEEREKIKLRDLTYKPEEKPIKTPSVPKLVKKWDKEGVEKASKLSGLPANVIQMLCNIKNITPMEAVQSLRESGMQ